jgi:hypothetical protein
VKDLIKLGCAALIMVFGSSCAIISHYGAYYGKVVDAETKEPLEGAAVLAVYKTEKPGPAGSVSFYLDAQETVTDKNGEFRIPPLTVTTFRVLHGFDPHPQFTIYKPGYGAYPSHKDVKPRFPYYSLPANQYVTIELPKLSTREERLQNYARFPLEVPKTKYKNLMRLSEEEAKSLGLEEREIREIRKEPK